MSKYLPTVPIEEFKMYLTRMNFQQLKSLLEGVYAFKRSEYKKHTPESPVVIDIERKETLIWKALNGIGINLKGPDFLAWQKKLANQPDKVIVVKN